MTRPKKAWIVDLAGLAEQDFADITTWSAENFGAKQAATYAELLLSALKELAANPVTSVSRAQDDIGKGFRTLHVSRPGRHLVLYRLTKDGGVLVVRILHDSMELARHLPPEGEA